MPLDPESVSLRPATPDDAEFLFAVYASSRGDDLRELGWDEARISEFLRMQYEAQQRFTESEYHRADDRIIMLDAKPVGRMLVERREHEIRGVDIALLPAYRDQGIGSCLIGRLQADAARARKPLRIQVVRFNRAISLLKRLGFERTSETGTHYQMEWRGEQMEWRGE
jgi:GNAT superfamily N-acetyltransferase